MTVAEASPGITVAGRIFRPVTSRPDGKVLTDQYNYLMSAIWSAEIAGAEHMREVFFRLAAGGKLGHVLAGLFVEEVEGVAQSWTAAGAARLAQFFGGPQEMSDVLVLQSAVIRELPDFFPGVRDYSASSVPASVAPETPALTSETPSLPTPSENSDPTSGSLPTMTPTSSPVLGAGL